MKEKQASKNAGRVALRVLSNVLLYTVITVCLLGVILTIVSQRDADGTVTIFGMQMRVVKSPSMEKCEAVDVSGFEIGDIPKGSMIFIETVPKDADQAALWYKELRAGDVAVDIVDATDGKTSLVGTVLQFQTSAENSEVLFEPGATFRTQGFQIKNIGSVPVNFRLYVSRDEEMDMDAFLEAFDIWLSADPTLAPGGTLASE